MSDEPIIVNIAGSAMSVCSASATIGAIHTCTGRRITADDNYQLARSWAESSSEQDFREHAGYARLEAALNHVPVVGGDDLKCWRGRPFEPNMVPNRNNMEPPPTDAAFAGGRYNRENIPVLYLSDSEDGVAREVNATGRVLWVQGFTLPVSSLRLADMSTALSDPFVNSVFWFAEGAGELGSNVSHSFSQIVSELVAHRIDGMVVPGVRGDDRVKYRNVIVFNPHPKWPEWLEQRSDPKLISGGGGSASHR